MTPGASVGITSHSVTAAPISGASAALPISLSDTAAAKRVRMPAARFEGAAPAIETSVLGVTSPAKSHTPIGSPGVRQDRESDQQNHRPQATQPARAQGHQDQRERNEVVAETGSELDPRLAEMHPVHGRNGQGGDGSAGRRPVDPQPPDGSPGERSQKEGRARNQDASADRIRLPQGAT